MPNDTALFATNLTSLELLHSGKVRDIYALDDDRLMIVATDRLSAFDVILPDPIPGKGAILTRLSNFWFRHTANIAAHHLLEESPHQFLNREESELLGDRAVVVKRLRPLPVEAIVRGYLAGSGWQSYQRDGTISGVSLGAGLQQSQRLPEPIFTPSTKAELGNHDQPLSFAQTADLIGPNLAEQIRSISLRIYRQACRHAEQCGLIIADTKLEFGIDADGQPVIIDELLTPDSSRFWPADAWRPGATPPAFDKQFIRDHLESIGWNKEPPAPNLSTEVVAKTAAKYREAERRLVTSELLSGTATR